MVPQKFSCLSAAAVCVCRLLLCRGCNPRLRQTLQVVEPRTLLSLRPGSARWWSNWRPEQDTVTGRKPVWWSSWCSSWDRGDRARAGAPKSALRNYPVPLLRPASRPRGRCKVAKDQNNGTCQKKLRANFDQNFLLKEHKHS